MESIKSKDLPVIIIGLSGTVILALIINLEKFTINQFQTPDLTFIIMIIIGAVA